VVVQIVSLARIERVSRLLVLVQLGTQNLLSIQSTPTRIQSPARLPRTV
jgi:hypothetical protein